MNAPANTPAGRALATTGQQQEVALPEPKSFVDLLEHPSWRAKMASKLPSTMTIDRLKGVVLTAMNRQPKLMGCSALSMYQALTECATYDLWPGAQGHAWLIPYGNKKKGPDGKDLIVNGRQVWEDCVQFQLGYRGMMDLGYRSGLIEPGSFQASAVYEGDDFDIAYGSDSFIKHKPKILGDRGQVVGFYAVCRPKGGRPVFDVMRRDEVDAIRDRSKSGKSGPWVTDYNAMGMKTVLRRFWKMLPSSVTANFADLIERDMERDFDLSEGAQRVQRAKIATVTGEVRTKKPEWTPEQLARQGTLINPLYKISERAEAEAVELMRRMKYDDPDDVNSALEDLLAAHEREAAAEKGAAPTTSAEAPVAPPVPKTVDDARALIQSMQKGMGEKPANRIIDTVLDEFGAASLSSLDPALLGEFVEKLQAQADAATGAA